MLNIFYHTDSEICKVEGTGSFDKIVLEKVFWVDMLNVTDGERRKVETLFKMNFSLLKSENELESNARFYESEDLVFISANFITVRENHFESTPVFLYLLSNVLVTERVDELISFTETVKKMHRNRKAFRIGSDVLEGILETKFDLDADFIERIAKEIASVSRSLSLKDALNKEELLLKISEHQESTTLSRESFIDKQRVVSALLKSEIFENKERYKILLNDINAMLEYCSFIFLRLEYLQNTILGLINIDQNKTIKIFTIVAVVFMPPTLIASIYGMNFKWMPELDWKFGYPFAVLLIIGSSFLTLLIFKKRKWL